MQLPPEKQSLLNDLVARLSAVPGVRAVVLGGSYARGAQRPGSDLDIGLYYAEAAPFEIDAIRRVAAGFAPDGALTVTGFYEWGAWVNGGAWIHNQVSKVDFLYRNIDQVQRAIDDALRGVTHHDFDQQPAYGFYSVIYLGETFICKPLYDPQGIIARLKEQVAAYPPLLKEKVVAGSLWMAEFSLLHADGYAANGDVYTTAGALTRTASFLTQALFALNETYYMNDKTAMKEIAAFPIVPAGYVETLSGILGGIGRTPAELQAATRALRGLWSSVVALTGGAYQPAFKM